MRDGSEMKENISEWKGKGITKSLCKYNIISLFNYTNRTMKLLE